MGSIAEGKMFSPGNLRATCDNPEYKNYIDYLVENQYTLRYTGGMVPDVFQIIVKEKGVFSNVISPSTKAKLRLVLRRQARVGPRRQRGRPRPADADLLRFRRGGEAVRGVPVRQLPPVRQRHGRRDGLGLKR